MTDNRSLMTESETIVAQVTPPGRAGVAIIRVSGPKVNLVMDTLIGKKLQPRYAYHLPVFSQEKAILDQGIIIYFNQPHSFTGEAVLEIQGHGGPVVVDLIIKEITRLGVRLARPGEFSEQAFLNNKIDLTQAEAIADLINAASVSAARSAMQSLQGVFSSQINELLEKIIKLRMMVEAAIDFPEEEIDFLSELNIEDKLAKIINHLNTIEMIAQQGRLINEGMTVVIAGKPNAGKSSLLNCLSGEARAIVTEIPGTTRDVLREQINIDGLHLNIIDTAGLRATDNIVEQIGVDRAKAEIAKADRVLVIVDDQLQKTNINNDPLLKKINREQLTIIYNKIDLTGRKPQLLREGDYTVITLSAKMNLGIGLLRTHLKHCMGYSGETDSGFSARRRHLVALRQTKQHLIQANQQCQKACAGELVAEDLLQAQNCLNEITGKFCADDLLGRIFGEFCIGK